MDIKIGVYELETTTRTICQVLPLNCTLIYYNGSEYGTAYENGTATGMVGMVHRGEFDTFQPIFTPTYARFQSIDFSDAYLYSDIMLVTRANSDDPDQLNFDVLIALKWQTWLVFLIALFVTSAYINLRRILEPQAKFQIMDFIDPLTGIVTHNHKEKHTKYQFVRVVTTFWSLVMIILTSAYTGFMFSEKMKDPASLPYKDLESFADCFDSGRCNIIDESLSVSSVQWLLQKTKSKRQDYVRVAGMEDIPNLILNERDIYLVWAIDKLYFSMYAGNNADCKFYFVEGFKEVWSFPLRKHSPFKAILDRGAALFQEYGWDQTEFNMKNLVRCIDRSDARIGSDIISFLSVIYAGLCVLGIGIGGASTAFLLEVVRNRLSSRGTGGWMKV